ncbi:hypothetical protein [Haloarcula sediminis]|uniref:hypothetical protein n=1 Tax=Haloarcula sediminis TaxID=3111777 RepID=UPI002D7949D1|nr:hypothetical protein [Haloarcula sp. CK38]
MLLGGLAIAIVFLTAIPLSNSLVVSESASTSETVADIDRAAEREASVNRGLRAIVRDADPNDPAALNRSLRNFSRYYTNVSGQQDGVYVNATVNVTASRGGVVNATGGDFKAYNRTLDSPPHNGWVLIEDSERISMFVMQINKTDSRGKPNFTLSVSNASGTTWQMRIDGGANTTVKINTPDGSSWTDYCSSNGDLNLDIKAGECRTDTGRSPFPTYTETVNEPYSVRYDNAQKITDGSYRLAGIGEFPTGNSSAVVVPAVELTYVGPDTTYERRVLVNETS